MDVALLSRIQFAFTMGFHIIWPILTIGLVTFLAITEACWLKTDNPVYLKLYKFFAKIFALAFGMGVVTGIPLAYQFGTNFSEFSHQAGAIIGPLLGVEVMTAFFLEAAFIGVMLFGWNHVSPKVHFLATVLVAVGTYNSTFWVISANSWMQTPQGHGFEAGRMFVEDWWQIIFNPSFPYRLSHMLVATYLSAALFVSGICAYFLLKRVHIEVAKKGFKMAILMVAILAPIQIFIGDLHGLHTKEHQPAKVAAIEALWETRQGAPLVLWAIPDRELATNRYAIEIPKLASLILTHDWNGEVKGLNEFKEVGIPSVATVFYAFRLMVGLGTLFLFVGVWGAWATYRGNLYRSRWLQRLSIICAPLGVVATISGWIVTEVGRQPWIIQGVMKTRDALSPIIPEIVSLSLLGFVIVYTLMGFAFLYYVHHLIQKGPETFVLEEEWLELVTHTAHITPKGK